MRAVSVPGTVVAVLAVAAAALGQTSVTPRSPRPAASGSPASSPRPLPPPSVPGYVVTVELRATAPGLKPPPGSAPEARAMASALRRQTTLTSRFHLTEDLSRQEVLSTDFILPQGTLVLHKAGEQYYAIADPREKTFLVMDSEALLNALEGGAGIENSQYEAKVQHTDERKTIAGLPARKSIVTVTYVSSIPFENDRLLVQQKNDIEVWHTSSLVSSAANDHFFFKFQRDKTGQVHKAVSTEIGFPLEVTMVATQGTGKKATVPQAGSLHMLVTEVRKEARLDSELFRIPPAGFKRVEKNPYFAAGALSQAGAKIGNDKQ
jgi:hypothetical protein